MYKWTRYCLPLRCMNTSGQPHALWARWRWVQCGSKDLQHRCTWFCWGAADLCKERGCTNCPCWVAGCSVTLKSVECAAWGCWAAWPLAPALGAGCQLTLLLSYLLARPSGARGLSEAWPQDPALAAARGKGSCLCTAFSHSAGSSQPLLLLLECPALCCLLSASRALPELLADLWPIQGFPLVQKAGLLCTELSSTGYVKAIQAILPVVWVLKEKKQHVRSGGYLKWAALISGRNSVWAKLCCPWLILLTSDTWHFSVKSSITRVETWK